jgi:eukaryotic-like serine/threonine-protein kinase
LNGDVLAGRYRLLALLGRGGAGEVWRAEDLALTRPVAVKVLRRLDGDPMDSAERFRTEARAAARLTHPNVVATYDVGTAAGQVFLVMELVSGKDLAQFLRSDGLPPAQLVADLAVQGTRALDAAHAAGIVHRDVKPGNLLLATDGTLKITDFGIAQATDLDRPSGQVLLGTAAYVAPEQVRGEPAVPASDRYALGCVLYELLAGTPPFTAGDVEGVLEQHLHAAPVPIQVHRPDVGPGLGDLVMRLLAKDPAARPASVAEVVACLARGDSPATWPAPSPEIGDSTRVLPVLDGPARGELPHGSAEADPAAGSARLHPIPRRLPYLRIMAALAAVIVVLAVVALLREGGSEPAADAGATQSLPVASNSTARPKPTATPSKPRTTRPVTPSVTPSAPRTAGPAALRTLARLVRERSEGRGTKVTREAARDLDQAAEALAEGDTKKAAGKFQEVRERLAEAQRDDRWEPTPEITALLTSLGRSLRDSG